MRHLLAAMLLAVTAPAVAQDRPMTAGEFLARAEALEKKGMMALLSSDIGRLKREIKDTGRALRAHQEAERKAGRRPAHCIPEEASINSGELMRHLRAIPPAQRDMSFRAAFAALMQKKYPCR